MISKELVIIGGGSAGLNAAVSAYDNGIRDILIIEEGNRLGGILNQCIHNGFGLHLFNEELTGPGFAAKCIDLVNERNIECKMNTSVINVTDDRKIEYLSPTGSDIIQAKAIIFSIGCYERSRGAISTPGYRPDGVYTAGSAQKMLNEEGFIVGKRCFILGSGDIGLIMARRMTLEGAKVLGVAELMPYSNGLKRNIVQCLTDFDIPLYLSHTVTNIYGKDRLTGIELTEVDDKLKPIKGTEKRFDCDTILLSIGLIPENSLLHDMGAELDPVTKGPKVTEELMTNIDGVFACGNGLHVHDLVDYVADEAILAGKSAAAYLQDTNIKGEIFTISKAEGIGYILPQRAHKDAKEIILKTRVRVPMKKGHIVLKSGGVIIKEVKKINLFPAEMLNYKIKEDIISKISDDLEVSVVCDD